MSMRMDLSQSMRAEMRMKMAPRMIQSMEILQMPIMALQEKIDQELNDNPLLLDVAEADPGEAEIYKPDATSPSSETSEETSTEMAEAGRLDEPAMAQGKDDFGSDLTGDEEFYDFDDHFRENSLSRSAIDELSERKYEALMNAADRPQTLQAYLEEQLALLDLAPDQRQMAEFIINNLDERGYLSVSVFEIAREAGHAVRPTEVEEVLKIVQSFDPPGVAARSLKECLLLQIPDDHPHAAGLKALIQNHLEDIQFNRLPLIERKTGMSIAMIRELIEQIRRLDTRPGSRFLSSQNEFVIPDFVLEEKEGGGYLVRLVDESLPNLGIAKTYARLARNRGVDSQTREYLQRKLQAARWLIEAIEQRRTTLQRVAQEIINHQQKSIELGDEYLEPLKMQQIADKIGVHVTTISRAVDDKWISTPRGIFPLKRFFKGGTTTADGEEMAWDTIKQKLSELIAREDKKEPLSDEEIVKAFEKDGIKIARRTVTKYREAMHIPSSRQRKEYS
jgi:RNA polymerase sigma-54 factor